MKLGEIITLIDSSSICIGVDNSNDFYYYDDFRTNFTASVFNDNKLTETEVLNMTVKTITDGTNGIIIVVE